MIYNFDMENPKISLEQWRALLAVVDHGGYAQAAEALHKSQSTVTYAIQKLENLLGLEIFVLQGRKSVLTEAGRSLYQRARVLVDEAVSLEHAAGHLAAGCEAEVALAAEIIFPTGLLLGALAQFAGESPDTRVELLESVLGGTDEALLEHKVDVAITSHVPTGFLGDPLLRLRFIAVAHPDHPLHQLGRPVTHQDLRRHRRILIRDTGLHHKREPGWLSPERRWTVSNMSTSIEAVGMGAGFAWFPEFRIQDELAAGKLKPLPLAEGGERFVQIYAVYADRDYPGPAARRLVALLREQIDGGCPAGSAD